MRAQLEAQGFIVRHVVSAEAALAIVGECTPAVITLDILLPGMDGWEFLARLKKTAAWEGVPVVVVSVVDEARTGFSLGAALVLQKPIGGDALAKGLEQLGLTPERTRDATVLVIDDDVGRGRIARNPAAPAAAALCCARWADAKASSSRGAFDRT